MPAVRVFPTLLLRGKGLYKGVRFKDHRYIGDPINTVKLFNDKEVDEIVVLDIEGARSGRCIDVEFVRQFAAECFVPLTVGGGVSSATQARALLQAGAEKVLINSAAVARPELVSELAGTLGSSSVVVGIDYVKTLLGRPVVASRCAEKRTRLEPSEWAAEMEARGAGEILLTSVERDGTGSGYDIEMSQRVTAAVTIPVVVSGGLGAVEHMHQVVREAGVCGVTGGSFFVFQGPRRAVLISFPGREQLEFNGPDRNQHAPSLV